MRALGRTRACIAGLVAGIAMVVAAMPVFAGTAVTLVDTDRIHMGTDKPNTVCYGACGLPYMELEWRKYDDQPGIRRTVTGVGSLGAYGPNAHCARIKTIYRAKDGTKLAQRTGAWIDDANGTVACAKAGSGADLRGSIPIDNHHQVFNARLYSVTIILQEAPSHSGPWHKVSSRTCVWKTSDCRIN
jgi:hypothetical protein